MKCIGDEGECGIGGYCSECPWKKIADLERQLEDAGRELEEAQKQESRYRFSYEAVCQGRDRLKDQLSEAQADWNGLRDVVMGNSECINRSQVEHYANLHKGELAAIKEAHRWVAVDENYPDEDGSYLCHFSDGTVETFDFQGADADCRTWGVHNDVVTHWKPLDAPPEKG